MLRASNQFKENIQRVKDLGAIHSALIGMTSPALDASDILRAQVVMAVSALDQFVHELTLRGMLEVFDNSRSTTPAYLRFQVPIESTLTAIRTSGSTLWLEEIIREKHGYLSFQQPDKIADAIRLFSAVELWQTLASLMGHSAQDLKRNLRLIVDRRNKIAHEADVDPSYPGSRWPITTTDVSHVIDFIERLCTNIYQSV